MYRVILVDDEPLILAGIASLITWEDYGCTIIGKATNGPSALDMILKEKPDIVITDIRMPVLSGLELVEKCREAGCAFSFLVLTNLEEFHLVKKALSLGASDYLVKIELNEDALITALKKAQKACDLHSGHKPAKEHKAGASADVRDALSRLLLSQAPPETLPKELTEQYREPFVILFSLRPIHISFNPEDSMDIRQVSKQIMDILGGILSRLLSVFTLLEYNDGAYLIAASLYGGGIWKSCPTAARGLTQS